MSSDAPGQPVVAHTHTHTCYCDYSCVLTVIRVVALGCRKHGRHVSLGGCSEAESGRSHVCVSAVGVAVCSEFE